MDSRLRWLPGWLRPYAVAMAAFTGALALAIVLVHTVGTKNTLVYSLIGDLLVLGSAWLGYGPGALVCTLTTFLAPLMLRPGRPNHVDPGRFAVLVFICLLISRISVSKRRTEASLRQSAAELEARVRERTLELLRNEERRSSLAAEREARHLAEVSSSCLRAFSRVVNSSDM